MFKYNITRHSTTGQLPHTKWTDTAPPLQRLYAFGQIGTAYAHRDSNRVRKLDSRAFPARYLYAATTATIAVQEIQTGKIHRIRAIDFQPYRPDRNPVRSIVSRPPTAMHASNTQPTGEQHTQPPRNAADARRFPDSDLWGIAHDEELQKLDNEHTVKWLSKEALRANAKPIPLIMTYRYMRSPTGQLIERKARCSARGDKMVAHVH